MTALGKDVLDLGSWCILRMASADTLKVAKSLREVGLETWTPVEKRVSKMPKTGATFDRDRALMPSYAFGRVEHVNELLRLAMIPNRQHPRFWVFHHKGGIPLIADSELDALRGEEDRKVRVFEKWRRRGKKPPTLARGSAVKLMDGPFAGFPGIVEDTQGQFTVVSMTVFGKPVEIKVASLLIAENMANGELPCGIAA